MQTQTSFKYKTKNLVVFLGMVGYLVVAQHIASYLDLNSTCIYWSSCDPMYYFEDAKSAEAKKTQLEQDTSLKMPWYKQFRVVICEVNNGVKVELRPRYIPEHYATV